MKQDEDYKAIAQRIKQRRTELNLSLQDVADMTEMSKSTLQRYESGSIRNIPLQKLGTLASALQTSADWILGWCKNPDDIPPIDADFRKFITGLGFEIQAWPGYKSSIYLCNFDLGHAPITKEEYEQFRDSVVSYAKFNASNLLRKALERDRIRINEDSHKLKEFAEYMKQARAEEKEDAAAFEGWISFSNADTANTNDTE